jgi:hypothetical protein
MKSILILGLSALSCSLLMADEEVAIGSRARNKQTKNQSSSPAYVCPKAGPYLSMEYLYWRAQEDQLDFCAIGTGTMGTGSSRNVVFKPQTPTFKYTSGFRAAVGYDFNYEKYDVCLAWTYLHPKVHTRIPFSTTRSIITFPLEGLTDADVASSETASSKWHLAFDMLDLEIGRKLIVGKRFSFRPFLGVKGGWINQSQHTSYYNVELGQNSSFIEFVQGSMKRKNDFHAIGPRLGVDLRYGFGSEFGVFGTISGAALYGSLHSKMSLFLSDTAANGGSTGGGGPAMYTFKTSYNTLKPTVQLLIGADWSRCLYQKWMIHLSAGYETQVWWDQFLAVNSFSEEINVGYGFGTLMLQGLTAKARFDF